MAYPASKEPWLRLTEDYFRQGDYGNAILAAQEVTQRDARNPLAQSVLAVSGLRVSAQALGELRERASFEVGSRDEAVELTRQMRASLGEPVLVPVRQEAAPDGGRPALAASRGRSASAGVATPRNPPRHAPDPPSRPAVASAAAIQPVASVSPVNAAPVRAATAAPAPTAKGINPFKVLD